jgi:hypothetical protein
VDTFCNRLNERAHSFFIGKVVTRVNEFAKSGQVHVIRFLSDPLYQLGLLGNESATKAKAKLVKRGDLGLHQVGLTALVGILFLLLFLILA